MTSRALALAVAVAALPAACGGNMALKRAPAPDAGMDHQDALRAETEGTPVDGPSSNITPWDATGIDRKSSPADEPSPDLTGWDAASTEGGIDPSDTPRSDVSSNTASETGAPNTTRPDSVTWNAPLFFSDENGTWSITPDGQPKLIVARANAARITPSPFLDRLALTWQGQGTEIYDQQGQLLGWIPGDRFSGWTSDEAVVVDMGKWDIRGQAIHAFTAPTESVNVGVSTTRSLDVRRAAVSPDGQWLAVEYLGLMSAATYLHATNDGSKVWKVADGSLVRLIWSRAGDSTGLYKDGVAQLNAGFTNAKWLAFTPLTNICDGQAWVSDSTFLVWTYKVYGDTAYCADPYVVDTAHPDADPVHFVPKTALAEYPWEARGNTVFVISPDIKQIAYRFTDGKKGIVIANPDGGDPRTILAGRTISSLAWDSPNPKAPALDADKAPSKPDAGTEEPASLPGPSGKPSTSTNCQQGVWYQRSPNPLPARWPSPRQSAAHAFDSGRGLLVIDGGYGSGIKTVAATDTTWEWDGRAGTWTNRSPTTVPRPMPRAQHGMAYDSLRERLVSTGDANIWNYDPSSNRWSVWTCQNSFDAVDALFFLPRRDRFFVASNRHSAGWFSVNPCGFEQQALPHSSASVGVEFAMGYVLDSKRDKIWQVGGRNYGSTPLDITMDWKSIPDDPNGPGLREFMSLAFDQDRGVLMMFSGMKLTPSTSPYDISHPADLWEWNPDTAAWTLCSSGSSGPPARGSASMVYDSGRHALILFGGGGYDDSGKAIGNVADLWEWALP